MQLEMSARNAMVEGFSALFGDGSTLVFRTAGNVEVATIELNDDPFANASNGSIVANATTADASATGGVVAHAALFDQTPALQARLTVGTSSGEVIMTTLTIPAGATVSLASLQLTMPAGA